MNRNILNLDHVPAGPSSNNDDNIIYDSLNPYSQPHCLNATTENNVVASLPHVRRPGCKRSKLATKLEELMNGNSHPFFSKFN